MGRATSPLDAITVAAPCTVPWETMRGDDRKRYCEQCRLNVYDFSRMTRGEAEAMLRAAEGQRVCGRLVRRADGTLVTRDCGRVRAAIERRTRWIRTAAATMLGAIGLGGCHSGPPFGGSTVTTGVIAPKNWQPPPPQPPKPEQVPTPPPPAPAPPPTNPR